ncbi:MAG TPA: hypothetical protein VL979_01680 [Solirubrobacteraceae bacterium]|nr:hypothetical protein [Solirubrobacteraceae bacterium]
MGAGEFMLEVGLDLGSDSEELDIAVHELRDELLELDVRSVERQEVAAPEGARGAGEIVLGTLIVTATKDVVGQVVSVVARWISSHRSTPRVMVTIDGDTLTIDASLRERRQLVDLFVSRHTTGADERKR